MSKRLGGIKGCKYKTSSWHLNGFPDGITLGQQYSVGEKPTVILHIYINRRHAGTPKKHLKQTRKIRTRLDLLSIPQSGGKMSKRLGGIIGCK